MTSINAWGSDDPAEVAKGGTGRATLTNNALIIGQATSPVSFVTLSDGQVPIGTTGGAPTGGTINGTANEIVVTSGAASITVGIADDCVLPGNAAYTWVDGTTAQEPAGSNGQARYDTTTNKFRGYENGAWVDFITTSTGTGSWIHLNTQSIAAPTAQVSWNNTYITSTYGTYAILYRNVTLAASGSQFLMQVSNDNGSTWHATGYATSYEYWSPYSLSTASQYWVIGGGSSGLSNTYAISGHVFVHNMTDASARTTAYGDSVHFTATPQSRPTRVAGMYSTAETNNALRIYYSGGNITGGEFALYGIKNS